MTNDEALDKLLESLVAQAEVEASPEDVQAILAVVARRGEPSLADRVKMLENELALMRASVMTVRGRGL